ncbi:MAG: RNA polymerase sigma-70 factor (ECF subfamily) [Candidatus Promineifilaceae bacterium]|jgi:RNA polymerase sigma-70 factor (ECF subfamily)
MSEPQPRLFTHAFHNHLHMNPDTNNTSIGHASADDAIPYLLELHGGRMYNIGMRLCRNHADAEDMVQETFLLAYKNWDQFEGRANITTWLYTISARVCQRMHRLRSGQPAHMESLNELLPFGDTKMARLPSQEDDPAAQTLRADLIVHIETAISALPVEFRIPIILRDIVDLAIEDIANILNIKPQTVKTRIHRARLRVLKAVNGHLPQEDAPPPAYSKQMCMDLLRAKQEALDRGVSFPHGQNILCERCSAVFASLDLGRDLCRELGNGAIPPALRQKLLSELA